MALGLAAGAAAPASASERSIAPVAAGRTATFLVTHAQAVSATRAKLTAGHTSEALDVRSLRRAVKRGHLNVRVPRKLQRPALRLVLSLRGNKHQTTTTTTTTPGGDSTSTATGTGTTSPPSTTDPSTTPSPTTDTTTTGIAGDPSVVNVPTPGPALADAAAAALVKRASFEPRPDNATANNRVPTASELSTYRANAENWGDCNNYHQYVTGNFTGTTDEIIQWAAYKWGIDPNLARAVAVFESSWHMSAIGDGGISFGLFQIKKTFHTGTYPLSTESTAYNADFWAAMIRYYYDGCAGWLNSEERGQDYTKGDIWGSIGAWYAGRWHTADAESYISSVKQRLADQTWLQPGF